MLLHFVSQSYIDLIYLSNLCPSMEQVLEKEHVQMIDVCSVIFSPDADFKIASFVRICFPFQVSFRVLHFSLC